MTWSSGVDRRAFLAWAALAVGVTIALHQRHFTLSPTHPGSVLLMLRHRCGQVLAAAALWAGAETMLAAARRFRRTR